MRREQCKKRANVGAMAGVESRDEMRGRGGVRWAEWMSVAAWCSRVREHEICRNDAGKLQARGGELRRAAVAR